MSTARTTRLSRCRRTSVRLLSASGAASVVLASFLLGALDFALVKATTTPRRVEPFGLLEGLPGEAVAQAREWERHLVEVVTGLPPGAPQDAKPRPQLRRRGAAERAGPGQGRGADRSWPAGLGTHRAAAALCRAGV